MITKEQAQEVLDKLDARAKEIGPAVDAVRDGKIPEDNAAAEALHWMARFGPVRMRLAAVAQGLVTENDLLEYRDKVTEIIPRAFAYVVKRLTEDEPDYVNLMGQADAAENAYSAVVMLRWMEWMLGESDEPPTISE